MSKLHIGPLLACAIGDGYGAGMEFASKAIVRKFNTLKDYVQHPRHKEIKPGDYTDDTQMAMALAEHVLEEDDWNAMALASRWVGAFHRDKRTGYAKGFYDFLIKTVTAASFLRGIRPHSVKSGGAMRAFPIGFLPDTKQVRDLAMFQASLTHATYEGMTAAAAAALMFHNRYHGITSKDALPQFLDKWLPGNKFRLPWTGKVGGPGLDIVRAALTAFMRNDDLGSVLQGSVAFTGDVDTVAAIAMPAAAVCGQTGKGFPAVLVEGLENGTYGRDYIRGLDEKLAAKFPRRFRKAPELKQEPKQEPKSDPGILDFLCDED